MIYATINVIFMRKKIQQHPPHLSTEHHNLDLLQRGLKSTLIHEIVRSAGGMKGNILGPPEHQRDAAQPAEFLKTVN